MKRIIVIPDGYHVLLVKQIPQELENSEDFEELNVVGKFTI